MKSVRRQSLKKIRIISETFYTVEDDNDRILLTIYIDRNILGI